jgi:hypothetical protein
MLRFSTHSNFGQYHGTVTDTLHEDPYAFLCAFIAVLDKYVREDVFRTEVVEKNLKNTIYSEYAVFGGKQAALVCASCYYCMS